MPVALRDWQSWSRRDFVAEDEENRHLTRAHTQYIENIGTT